MVHRVLHAADEPPLVVVSIRRGHPLASIIRDSHHFALNILTERSRLLERKFDYKTYEHFDPFDTIEYTTLVSRSPILSFAAAALDCEVIRHVDMEADHELYVGMIQASVMLRDPAALTVSDGDPDRLVEA